MRLTWRVALLVWTICTMLWLYIGGVLLLILRDIALLPVWILVGSVATPGAILIALSASSRRRRLDPGFLLLAATAGGVLAIVIGGTVDALLQPLGRTPVAGHSIFLLTGFAEELAKLAVVLALGARLHDKSVKQGLLLGAAVGLGFAAFEDMGYAMAPFLDQAFTSSVLLQSGMEQVSRQLLTPFGHPLWSALLAAAVFSGARGGRFRLRLLGVAAFFGIAAAHSAWDAAITLGPQTLGLDGAIAAHAALWAITLVELVVLWMLVKRSAPELGASEHRR